MGSLTFIIETLPSTVNGWGFNGSTNRQRYVFSNGDIWISGTSQYRHMKSEAYVQHKADADRNWTGGLSAEIDVLGGFSKIKRHYERQGITISAAE